MDVEVSTTEVHTPSQHAAHNKYCTRSCASYPIVTQIHVCILLVLFAAALHSSQIVTSALLDSSLPSQALGSCVIVGLLTVFGVVWTLVFGPQLIMLQVREMNRHRARYSVLVFRH